MKILVIGSGGREHALCWKIAQSTLTKKIFCAPGNAGTLQIGKNIDIASNDIDSLLSFALKEKIDLTIVGPEEPLTNGIVDRFKEKDLKIFGPGKIPSQLEASKEFSKKLMKKYEIPTARYKKFTDFEKAKEGLKEFTYPLVIKADGLCLGKGVFICQEEKEALKVLKDILKDKCFGLEGEKIIIEEFLQGSEASLLCFVSGHKIIPMDAARDYKKIQDGDKGLNTGGIGGFSPSNMITKKLDKKIEEILDKISLALREESLDYEGIIFIGFMIDKEDIRVLEFNVRFGDPETQSLIIRLKSDLVDILLKTIDRRLKKEDLIWDKKTSVCLVLTSQGYPLEYEKAFRVEGLDLIDKNTIVFHNGTLIKDGQLVTNGGRVLTLCSLAENLEDARNNVYKEVKKISYENIYYRNDIANIETI